MTEKLCITSFGSPPPVLIIRPVQRLPISGRTSRSVLKGGSDYFVGTLLGQMDPVPDRQGTLYSRIDSVEPVKLLLGIH